MDANLLQLDQLSFAYQRNLEEQFRLPARILPPGASIQIWSGCFLLDPDAHPSLLSDQQLAPFQHFTLQCDAFATYPDLVGRLDAGGTTFAVEAKGPDAWLRR